MVLVLTLLTWVAAATLLIVLGWALAGIRNAFESTAKSLDKIAMGVRAIDTETSPLGDHLNRANGTLQALLPGLQTVQTHLGSADEKLAKIAAKLTQ